MMMKALIVYLVCMLGILFFVNVSIPDSTKSTLDRQDSINRILQPPSDVIEWIYLWNGTFTLKNTLKKGL